MSRYVAHQTSISIHSQIDKCVTWYTKSFCILHKYKTFNDQSIQPSSPARKWKNLTAKVVKAGKLRELGKYTLLNTPIRTWIERSREVKVWDENKQDGIRNTWTLCETAYSTILFSIRGSTETSLSRNSRVWSGVESSRRDRIRESDSVKVWMELKGLEVNLRVGRCFVR